MALFLVGESMIRQRILLSFVPIFLFSAICAAQGADAGPIRVASPNGQIVLILSGAGAASPPGGDSLRYAVEFHGKRLFDESALGIKIEGQPALGSGMRIESVKTDSADETYAIPVGKTSSVRD